MLIAIQIIYMATFYSFYFNFNSFNRHYIHMVQKFKRVKCLPPTLPLRHTFPIFGGNRCYQCLVYPSHLQANMCIFVSLLFYNKLAAYFTYCLVSSFFFFFNILSSFFTELFWQLFCIRVQSFLFLMVAQYWGSMLWSSPSICFSFSQTASTFIEFSGIVPEAGPDP